MNNEVPLISVSTDVGGFWLAHPADVQELYTAAGFRCNLELILFEAMMPTFHALARGIDVDYDLGGVHGQVGIAGSPFTHSKGPLDWGFILLANQMFASIDGSDHPGAEVETIAANTKRPIYYNVHNDAVANDYRAHLAFGLAAKYSHLTVENGVNPKDIKHTEGLIARLHDDGAVNTAGTFDLVHGVVALSSGDIGIGSVTKHWNKVLASIGRHFKHLHLPIGVNNDSLPIEAMIQEKAMLRALGVLIREKGLTITLENQHNLFKGADFDQELIRLQRIRNGFLECGIPV